MTLSGNPVSRGIAVGPVYLYEAYRPEVRESRITPEQQAEAKARYERTRKAAREELEAVRGKLMADDPEKAKIFSAHIDILYDTAMDEDVLDLIETDGLSPEWAVAETYDKYVRLLEKAKDQLIRERAADIRDVKNRFLRCWNGIPEKNLAALSSPVVVVARDLLPSDTATLDRGHVLGIVAEIGGATSHSAIIARSYGIPALLGVADAMQRLRDGEEVVLDAVEGKLYLAPDEPTKAAFRAKREDFLRRAEETRRYLNIIPVTPDGARVEVDLNIASAGENELAAAQSVDGVGLFRTEFLYMGRDRLPTEDEQFEIYRHVLSAFGKKPVTLRTLDIGGDKTLDCLELPHEANPFLGKRALRLCFDHLPVFRTQLRAALRASAYGNLWIMLPMVGSIDDIRRARAILEDVKKELDAQGVAYDRGVRLGIMVEIPSIALIADLAAREADFASIGTNDLTQYATAVDRLNPDVSAYYQTYHPALFRLIGYVVEQFNKAGKPVCVCGEMGGDPLAAAVLIGLGMRRLSMSASCVAPIKKLISGLTTAKAAELADAARVLPTAGEVEDHLRRELRDLL